MHSILMRKEEIIFKMVKPC